MMGRMASEPKTRPTDASVPEFLDAAQPARRVEEGHSLDAIMREETGEQPVLWGPSMVGYGSYRFVSPSDPKRQGDWPKVGFSPRKGAISLYGLKELPEGAALLPELGGCTEGAGCVGAGCVSVRRPDAVDEGVLRRLVRIAAARDDEA